MAKNLEDVRSKISEALENQEKALDLSYRKLERIPSELYQLKHLVELNLEGNYLTELPKDLNQLQKLERLYLSSNLFDVLPLELTNFSQLSCLDLSSNNIYNLPSEIERLAQLTDLDLSNNRLIGLPPQIGKLAHLTGLYLSNNQLVALPKEIGDLKQLIELYLSKNQLSFLPFEIGMLAQLSELNLSGNKLNRLPSSVGDLSQLVELNLSTNYLTSLPPEIGRLKQLTELNLISNHLSELPEEIGQLQQLERLSLKSNNLQYLPLEIGNLRRLKSLGLGENQLENLPIEITQLAQLTHLFLWQNRLQDLPVEIKKLNQLKELYLHRNQLRFLPVEVLRLKQLRKLSLSGNPDLNIPKEIIEDGIEAITNYLESIAESGEYDMLYEAKMVLVGDGAAGKTTLVRKLTDPQFSLNSKYGTPSTDGIDIKIWNIPMTLNYSNNFCLNIWDFAGQEKYNSTHQLFITEKTIYLFVTEARRESKYQDFDYWLSTIRLLSNGSPVIVIQTKIDERKDELPTKIYKEHFSNVVEFISVSCADGFEDTIEALKRNIRNGIRLLPQVGDKLPKSWVFIRKAIKKRESRNYISYREYEAICKEHGLNREKAEFLVNYFHNLGVVIHHRSSLLLKNMVIVNPEWATDALYNVLDSESAQRKKGRFNDDDLEEIWSEDKYVDVQAQLLFLLKKYELCFEIPESQGEYIAPNLLPKDKADYPPIDDTDLLRFHYKYEFMPSGILSKLIVKAHHLIEENHFWRLGCVFHYEKITRAEVIEDTLSRRITIAIHGPEKKILLSFIRKYLRDIHADFEKLEYRQLVQCICESCKGGSDSKPYFFNYERLRFRLEKGREKVECENSLEYVSVRTLLEGVHSMSLTVIKQLISKGFHEEAVEALKTFGGTRDYEHGYISLEASIHELKREVQKGVIDASEISLEKNKITHRLLNLVSQIEQSPN